MIGGQSVLAIIAARGGSKGVPRKNVQPVGGRPLIEWTILAAQQSQYVDRTILSSDDTEIMDVARQAGCEAPFRRRDDLADDRAGSVAVVMDAVSRLPAFDIVVLLQPTSPLREGRDIDAVLEALTASGAPSAVTVCGATDHPYLTFQMRDGRLSPYCVPPEGASLRRQDLPTAWVLNGAVYAVVTERLLRDGVLFHGDASAAVPMPVEKSLDIDTWADLRLADQILSSPRDVKQQDKN